ncbi:MAG: helix-turn-helix transcriptional regulator [Clostridiaceae bacterium]|nr:helix-turn-helix transcriptional regulator [Clostridiaceae bacterium]
MCLGNHLFHARKKCGLSQEEAAEALGVSRQTISKWETDETLPDICQSQKLAALYHLSLDELTAFDIDVKEIEQAIERTSPETEKKVDWSQAWGKKYPILLEYQKIVDVKPYAAQLEAMLEQLKSVYGYQDLDAFLVLKDILAKVWTEREKQTGAGETGE